MSIATPSSRLRSIAVRALPWCTAVWVFVELLSLRLGLLDAFFFDTSHADVQAIDFYSLPKAWLNLCSGKSLYATFDPPAYGPHFTWYLAHPVLALTFGPLFSRFTPGDSYGLFTLLSSGLMALCAWLFARETADLLTRRLLWLLFLGAFPTFSMLYVGNVQAFTVLSLSLLFVGLWRLHQARIHASRYLFAGLLLSLLTKPVVLILLPLLLLLKGTRRAAAQALGLYVILSLVCELTPALNPEPIGLRRVMWLCMHPSFVRAHMNIYANRFALKPDMRDNSIHWFNLIAQSGYRLQHIDIFSLPVFLDQIFGRRTPDWLYTVPSIVVLVLSVLTARLRAEDTRHGTALLLSLAGSLSFFLSYPTVWEYQYTAVLPVAGSLLLVRKTLLLSRHAWWTATCLAACSWLPSLYVFSRRSLSDDRILTLVRLDRVVPVTMLFVLLVFHCTRAIVRAWRQPSAATTTQDCSSRAESPA